MYAMAPWISASSATITSSGCRFPKRVKSESQRITSGTSRRNRIAVNVPAWSGATRWSKIAQAGIPTIAIRPPASAVVRVRRFTSARKAARWRRVSSVWVSMGSRAAWPGPRVGIGRSPGGLEHRHGPRIG